MLNFIFKDEDIIKIGSIFLIFVHFIAFTINIRISNEKVSDYLITLFLNQFVICFESFVNLLINTKFQLNIVRLKIKTCLFVLSIKFFEIQKRS
jgi:hypothetical protein